MDKEKVNKIIEIAKKQNTVKILDVKEQIGLSISTAQIYLLEMELSGILERVTDCVSERKNYDFKTWRLKPVPKKK